MRAHVLLTLTLLAAPLAALSACSHDDAKARPAVSLTPVTLSCPRFADTARKITDAQTALYSGTGGSAAIDTLDAELAALQDGAPPDVRAALTELSASFRDAQAVLEKPTAANKAKLAGLSAKLAADGQKVSAYITGKCG